MSIVQTRRTFLAKLAATAGVGLLPISPAAAESPLETTTIRLPLFAKITDCQTPQYVADDLLRAEGFTDIKLIEAGSGPDSSDWIAQGEVDFDWNFSPVHIESIQKGAPIKVLTGLHAGCLELIANDSVRGITELQGKRIGIDLIGSNSHKLFIIITSYIGFNPSKDFELVTGSDSVEMFADGKIDAFLGTPPQPQIMRERKLGHVMLSTTIDRPWAQYFCCMLSGNDEYVTKYPVATKRAMRALLKAVDLCVSDPEKVARISAALGRSSSNDHVLQVVRSDARFDKWREFDPEDTIRFYTLRMQEAGMIDATPQSILAQGTEWRFLRELKRELKA